MRRTFSVILVLLLLICCNSTGCNHQQVAHQTSPDTQPATTHPASTDLPQRPVGPIEDPSDNGLWMGDSGKMRIRYIFNQSSVRYVTAVDQLPDYEQLKVFDEEFFAEKALVLVTETVASGSVDVSIDSIKPDGTMAVVTLHHKLPDGIGTGDMTTWMIWVVVDRGLDYTWVIANPAVGNGTSNT